MFVKERVVELPKKSLVNVPEKAQSRLKTKATSIFWGGFQISSPKKLT
jgi:hypothetical protein